MLHVLSLVGVSQGVTKLSLWTGFMLCVNPNMVCCLSVQESHGAGGL